METIEFEFSIDQDKIPYIHPLVYDLPRVITLRKSKNKFISSDLPISITITPLLYDTRKRYRMIIEFLVFHETKLSNKPYGLVLEKYLVKFNQYITK